MRMLIAAASALAALILISSSQAAFPASQGRLLLISENQGFAAPELLRTGQPLVTGVPVGIHGTAAMSPDGTQMALVAGRDEDRVRQRSQRKRRRLLDESVRQRRHRSHVEPRRRHPRRLVARLAATRLHEHANRWGRPLPDGRERDADDADHELLRSRDACGLVAGRKNDRVLDRRRRRQRRLQVAPDGSGLTRITNNATEDLVQDWQALHDTTIPTVHALKSSARRGARGRFRFTIREDSGTAAVTIEYSYRTKNGSAGGFGTQTFHGLNAGHVYGISFPTHILSGAPSSFRFCVTATDPSANDSARSCARFHLLSKKKKR